MLSINQRMANVSFKANVMPKNQAQHIDNILHSGKSVDIFCHSISDEDTFNSATAFYNYLKQEGINARIIASGGKSNFGYDTTKYNIIQANEINEKTKKADVALCVDFSSKDRLNSNVYKHLQKYDTSKIVGIDHHDDKNKLHSSFNQITKVYEKNQVPELEAKNYYIDSSAKSNCGIIYRFFEALGKTPSKEITRALYTGFCDDTAKSKSGLDKNSKEVKSKLSSALNLFDIAKIKKHFIDKTMLTKEERAFEKKLPSRVQYSQNGKMAFIEITNDDEEWNNIGRNTEKASIILGKFRKATLEKNKNLESVAVFYPCSDGETYKMSITSNNDYAMKIVNYAKEHYSRDIIAGGHPERCGGSVLASNPIEQHNWVNYFVKSADKIAY